MTEIPGQSSAIASPHYLPGPSPLGWPAPYAEGAANPWIGQLLVGLPLAVAVLDDNGRIMAGNEALAATIGGQDWQGMDPASLVIEEDVALFTESIRQVVSGEIGRCEVRVSLRARPSDRLVVHIATVPPGLGVSAVLGLPDVREQLRLEAQVVAATRMQAVGQLAGGIAHDFNNILTAVLALSDQITERHQPGTADGDAAAQIGSHGRRAAALVAQLLAFSRRQPQRAQLLDMTDLLAELEPLLRQLVGMGVLMTLTETRLPFMVRADPGQIEQVIVNLVVNARDAMAGGAFSDLDIRLSVVRANKVAALGHPIMPQVDYVALEVEDTGSGIAPDIAGKIFEPFFTTKKMGAGTGLGLSTVYGIIKQSGGFIFARGRPGGGTVFSVYLPAVPRPARLAAPDAPAKSLQTVPVLKDLRLLMCEDEDAIRDILALGLRRHGLIVEAVANADLAIAALAAGPAFDVLLSDVMMPGVDGVELASQARAAYPNLAVLLMSGFAEPPLHKAAAMAGIGFIAKPFALSDLIASLAEAVEQPTFKI
jgi:signal transduction histidine kinase/ActR/RegA family two-component response regulator